MLLWRIIAIVLGSALMTGELIRSWGQGRNLIFVVDDFLIGIPLVLTGILMAKPSIPRHCAFSAAYAACAGGLYSSFFGKLVQPAAPMASNINSTLLTALIGTAFACSLFGLVASILAAGLYDKSLQTSN